MVLPLKKQNKTPTLYFKPFLIVFYGHLLKVHLEEQPEKKKNLKRSKSSAVYLKQMKINHL